MGLIYDNPDLVALTLTRLAAEEAEGPGGLEGHIREYLGDLELRNGTAYLELVAITLARVHFKILDDLARSTGANSTTLLDAAEMDALGGSGVRPPTLARTQTSQAGKPAHSTADSTSA